MTAITAATELRSFTLAELQALCQEQGWPAFRAKQLFQWLQQKGAWSFSEMSNIPQSMRDVLAEKYQLAAPQVLKKQCSKDGTTVKWLLEFADGAKIETVLMLYERETARDRATVCVSSQSGCGMGCAFCATGQYKEYRNLTAGEIIAQCLIADKEARERGFNQLTNIVFMGMGEPLLNMDNLKRCILLINDEQGLNIGQRKMTVSTCGIVPRIYELADWNLQIGLAISLHSADAEVRKRLMPKASHYSLNELLEAVHYFREHTGRRVTAEYALFQGVNATVEAAHQLGNLLTGTDILVNIIPANYVEGSEFLPCTAEEQRQFLAILSTYNVSAQVRESRGTDIDAACGQLRRR
ncbi:MAG: 23S rRNA (adenine(2503)-C(2))-methyltransferase RlmN [Firmicutes bacterium]|nr:23S rRNA (adenine(2503)-C(2))-methyltransferase RlmN [Bacillota bacterium]